MAISDIIRKIRPSFAPDYDVTAEINANIINVGFQLQATNKWLESIHDILFRWEESRLDAEEFSAINRPLPGRSATIPFIPMPANDNAAPQQQQNAGWTGIAAGIGAFLGAAGSWLTSSAGRMLGTIAGGLGIARLVKSPLTWVITAIGNMVWDFWRGWANDQAESLNNSQLSNAIAAALTGSTDDTINVWQRIRHTGGFAAAGALAGARIGARGGPIGALAGGLIGAIVGFASTFISSNWLADKLDQTWDDLRRWADVVTGGDSFLNEEDLQQRLVDTQNWQAQVAAEVESRADRIAELDQQIIDARLAGDDQLAAILENQRVDLQRQVASGNREIERLVQQQQQILRDIELARMNYWERWTAQLQEHVAELTPLVAGGAAARLGATTSRRGSSLWQRIGRAARFAGVGALVGAAAEATGAADEMPFTMTAGLAGTIFGARFGPVGAGIGFIADALTRIGEGSVENRLARILGQAVGTDLLPPEPGDMTYADFINVVQALQANGLDANVAQIRNAIIEAYISAGKEYIGAGPLRGVRVEGLMQSMLMNSGLGLWTGGEMVVDPAALTAISEATGLTGTALMDWVAGGMGTSTRQLGEALMRHIDQSFPAPEPAPINLPPVAPPVVTAPGSFSHPHPMTLPENAGGFRSGRVTTIDQYLTWLDRQRLYPTRAGNEQMVNQIIQNMYGSSRPEAPSSVPVEPLSTEPPAAPFLEISLGLIPARSRLLG